MRRKSHVRFWSGGGVGDRPADRNRLVEVRDPVSRTVQYGYDGANNLAVVTDTLGLAWRYSYTGTHRLEEARDPAGRVI